MLAQVGLLLGSTGLFEPLLETLLVKIPAQSAFCSAEQAGECMKAAGGWSVESWELSSWASGECGAGDQAPLSYV